MNELISNVEKKFIDIDTVIKNKNARLFALLPPFVLNYIKRIVHESQINDFISKNKDKYELDFVDAILKEFDLNLKVIGKNNIPPNGGCIFASNHPLGALDAMALTSVVGSVRKDIKFVVNDILLHLKNLKSLFVPVNKHGRNSPEIVQQLETVYTSDNAVLIFPAGLVSRKHRGGIIKDLTWKKSFITRSKKYKKNVIPVYIDGENSDFFYNLALWRERIGIKANIEMFYLVNEMYKQKNKTITIIIGEQIPYETFNKIHSDHYWAEKIKEYVYSLPKEKKPFKKVEV